MNENQTGFGKGVILTSIEFKNAVRIKEYSSNLLR